MKHFFSIAIFLGAASLAYAKPVAPLPDDVWDGGVLSAESLGRGRTTAANLASPAAGSENPAALNDVRQNVSYATTLVGVSSNLDKEIERNDDPLRNRTFQYFSMQGEKGVIFYEPLSRFSHTGELANVPGGTSDVHYEANALGIGGAETWGKGSFGLAISYLWSSLAVNNHLPGLPDDNHFDTSDGLRLTIGVRQPTGPFMWGLVLQNVPAFLWGGSYKRQMLPPSVRVGNTWRAYPGVLFSADYERRFYNEGGHAENFVYLGSEIFSGDKLILRAGTFGTNISKSEERHVTGGVGLKVGLGAEVSYAYEAYKVLNETVKRSIVSLKYPFDTGVTTEENARQ